MRLFFNDSMVENPLVHPEVKEELTIDMMEQLKRTMKPLHHHVAKVFANEETPAWVIKTMARHPMPDAELFYKKAPVHA